MGEKINNIEFVCAIGHNIAVILETNHSFIYEEINNLSHHLDDFLIDWPEKYGVYKWTGRTEIAPSGAEDGSWEPEYHGNFELLYEIPQTADDQIIGNEPICIGD